MVHLLDRLSALSSPIIAGLCAAHLLGFMVLAAWARRDLRSIAGTLDGFTRGLRHRSVLDRGGHLSDQIEAFLSDVDEVLARPRAAAERAALRDRINVLDERRGYLNSISFETAWNTARGMVEAYPLLGVLGTILAIGAALGTGGAGGAEAASVSAIVGRFGEAIWSTFAGLTAAVLLMFVSSLLEPKFARLAQNRVHVRETIAAAKRELSLGTAGDGPGIAEPKSAGGAA